MISVIIPCYNHGQYLERTVNSVVNQTFFDWEIIIVNDGSTDATEDVAGELVCDRISLISQENKGLGPSRNVGFENAKYDWVVPLDADDFIMPNFMEKCIEKSENADIVYTDVESTLFGDLIFNFDAKRFVRRIKNSEIPHVPCCTCLIRKEIWEKTGGYRHMLWEDWDFWLSCVDIDARFVKAEGKLFTWDNDKHSMKDQAFEQKDKVFSILRMNHPELFLGYGE